MRLARVFQGVFLVGLIVFSTSVFASEIRELAARERANHSNDERWTGPSFDRLVCVDGLKIFQTVAFAYGNNSGAAVSNIQLYEDKNGKVVPVLCDAKKTTKK